MHTAPSAPPTRRKKAPGHVPGAFVMAVYSAGTAERSSRRASTAAGTEHVVERHRGAADDAGPVAEGRGEELEVASGQRRGACVDALADAGRVDVERRRHVATDHDRLRVEEVDGRSPAPRRAGVRSRGAATWPRGPREVACATSSRMWVDRPTGLAARRHKRPAAGQGLEAAVVTAPAGPPGRGVDLGVADLAGAAEVARDDVAVRDDAEAEPGGGLEHQQVVHGARLAEPLGPRQHVGVVADVDGRRRSASARYGASSIPSQDAMTGESTHTPRTGSMVPGRLSPTPRTGRSRGVRQLGEQPARAGRPHRA